MSDFLKALHASILVPAIPVVSSLLVPAVIGAQARAASCAATPSSMTPAAWVSPAAPTRKTAPTSPPLALVVDVPLPGPAKRFDYQSFDSTTGRLYISHMRGDRLVVFDTRMQKLIASNEGFPGATGVWAVPQLHYVYVAVTGRHEVAEVDDRTLAVVAHVTVAKQATHTMTTSPIASSSPSRRRTSSWPSTLRASELSRGTPWRATIRMGF